MRMKMWVLALVACVVPGIVMAQFSATAPLKEELLKYGPFGNVLVYSSRPQPEHVMLFISGDGGFDKPFINMVKTVARPDTMVVAVDINTYLNKMAKQKNSCTYAAADLEGLSQYVQGYYKYPVYKTPVLVGYSSGATTVYAAAVQGPPNTFAGVISLGFCSDLPSAKPFCKGAGLSNTKGALLKDANKNQKNFVTFTYSPVSATVVPWFSLQGGTDQVCPEAKAKTFMSTISNATVIDLPTVGHGFAASEKWQQEFMRAFDAITGRMAKAEAAKIKPQPLNDLPLIENGLVSPKGKPLAVIVTGDGGWAGIDREIGGALNAEGINVVGLNSLQYFWKPKTPEQMGKDLLRILAWYEAAWSPSHVVLIGYSQGADTLPFMVNRLPQAQKDSVRTIALLGAGKKASLAFHVSDWLLSGEHEDDLPIKPEAMKLPNVAKLCFYGADEAGDSLCPTLDATQFTIIKTPGGHHFGGDYKKLADDIMKKAL